MQVKNTEGHNEGWSISRKCVIIAECKNGYVIVFTTFKAACLYFQMPYHTVKALKLPIEFSITADSAHFAGTKWTIIKKSLFMQKTRKL